MKKIALFIFLATLSFSCARAQGPAFSLGMEGGANMDKISGQSFQQQFDFNYYVGAYANLGLTKGFGIQPEVLFSQATPTTSAKFSEIYSQFFYDGSPAGNQRQASLNYLSIPILASVALFKGFYLQAGPQYSLLINQNRDLLDNGAQAFKNGNFAMVGGVWIKLPFRLNVTGRYVIGMSNINDLGDQDKWTTQSIQLGIGVTL